MSRRSARVRRTSVGGPYGKARDALILRVTEGSVEGWGEASPLAGYAPDTLDEAERELRSWAAGWEEAAAGPAIADLGPSARCAVDTALLDMGSRARSVPLRARLAEMLPPIRTMEAVPVCALVALPGVDRVGIGPVADDAVAEVGRRVAEGYRAVKFKVGAEGFEDQVSLLARVRYAHPDLHIRLDANGCWSADEARSRLATLADRVRPDLVEQPVGPADLLTFGAGPVPIAADESLRLPGALRALAETAGCRAIVLKPMVLGGLSECAALAARAHDCGMEAIVSHTFGGPISHAAACELALAVAAASPAGSIPIPGLAGHDGVRQMDGPRITAVPVLGHGAGDA
jgi:o-succinylbenzoate synthase